MWSNTGPQYYDCRKSWDKQFDGRKETQIWWKLPVIRFTKIGRADAPAKLRGHLEKNYFEHKDKDVSVFQRNLDTLTRLQSQPTKMQRKHDAK